MQLVNAKSGHPEDVPQDSAFDALRAGSHNLVAGQPVNVMGPGGELGSLPAEQIPEAVARYGYKIPTQADLTEHENQQKYGEGAGPALAAGALGAARGLTFGLSDVGLAGTGLVTSATLQQLRQRNPTVSTATEVGGAVAGAALAPELSLPGRAAGLGARIAEGVAPAALGEGASLAARVVQGAKATGATALGSAVEGALYGAGENVTEAALGDPDLHAERLAANIGFGALTGGALGGLIKAGSLAAPASFDAAKSAISHFYDRFVGRPEMPGAASAVDVAASGAGGAPDVVAAAGAPPAEWQPSAASKTIAAISGKGEPEVRSLLQAAHEGELMTPEAKDKFVRELTDNMQEQYETVQRASKDAINTVRPQENVELLKGADPTEATKASSDAVMQMRHAIAEMRTNPDLYPARFPAKAEKILEGLEDRTSGGMATPADSFNAINQAKQSLDKLLRFGKDITGESTDAINLLRGTRGQLKTNLEDEKVWGAAAARQAAFNGSNHDLATATTALRKRFMEKTEGRGGSIEWKVKPSKVETYVNQINDNRARPQTEALLDYFRAAKGHVQEIGKTYEAAPFESFDKEGIEGVLNRTQDATLRAKTILEAQPGGHGAMTDWLHPLSAVAKHAAHMLQNPVVVASKLANMERAAQKTAGAVEKTAKALFKDPRAEKTSLMIKATGALIHNLTPEERQDRLDKQLKPLDEFHQSPDEAVKRLDGWTQEAGHVAPNIASSLQQTAIRGMQFLASKAPRSGAALPLDHPHQPSMADIAKFERYHSAVHDPVSVFKEMKQDRLTPEGLETLQTVYPKLYDDMKMQIVSHLGGTKVRELPYQRRLVLGKFLGEPLDSSMTPAQLVSNQTILAGQKAQREAKEASERAFRPSGKGAASIDLGTRYMTRGQQAIQRGI